MEDQGEIKYQSIEEMNRAESTTSATERFLDWVDDHSPSQTKAYALPIAAPLVASITTLSHGELLKGVAIGIVGVVAAGVAALKAKRGTLGENR